MISTVLNNPGEVQRMERLKAQIGGNMALFVMCAYHDVPFHPDMATSNWLTYLKSIGTTEIFADGETDPNKAMEQGYAEMDRWLRVWGAGNEDKPYTPADYRRMDEIYENLTARRREAGGFDGQVEDIFRFCARTAHLRDQLMAKGDKDNITAAANLDKMIQTNLASANLRKKDEGPKQDVRLDGVVTRLEKMGLGIGMTKDEFFRAFAAWTSKHNRYGCTQDAAEKGLLAIINCTRGNNDQPLLTEVPEEAYLDDCAREFDATAARREESAYGYLNLRRGRPKPKEGD